MLYTHLTQEFPRKGIIICFMERRKTKRKGSGRHRYVRYLLSFHLIIISEGTILARAFSKSIYPTMPTSSDFFVPFWKMVRGKGH